jgi:hypothetical protein
MFTLLSQLLVTHPEAFPHPHTGSETPLTYLMLGIVWAAFIGYGIYVIIDIIKEQQ